MMIFIKKDVQNDIWVQIRPIFDLNRTIFDINRTTFNINGPDSNQNRRDNRLDG